MNLYAFPADVDADNLAHGVKNAYTMLGCIAGVWLSWETDRKYIRFEDGKILLGEVGNELELQIANDRINFLQDGAEVAYFTNRKLYVTDAQFLHSLQLGSFAFMPRANGNLSFKKV